MIRPKIAVTHPRLGFGGSESVALWAIEALKVRNDVSLVTGGPVDLARLNEYYGTNIQAGEIEIVRAPLPLPLAHTAKFAALRGAAFLRYCRRMAPRFDLLINTYGLCDFAVPSIQCVADFSFVRQWRSHLHPDLARYRRWWYGDSPLRRTYLNLCDATARPNPEAWKRNLTLANSHWTAGLLREKFEIASQVLYPPVAGNLPNALWEQRENGFLCVGRVVPEKRTDAVIKILSRVRRRGGGVHLHILGGVDDSPFGRAIQSLAERNRDWIFLEGRVSGPKKADMLASHRFAINGCMHEAFGIAAAEMVKAGGVVFVPNGGGQTEIVDHPALTFENEDDAVKKIEAVLSGNALREDLRRHLSRQAMNFSVEKFQASLCRFVDDFRMEKCPAARAVLVR
ncbi:MAG TPA: glycosyltransferase family 4 protein [Candidatus Dormibacteraeota bacterium]|nr:glycosyltransferase family 4 protein [Candidatus Dormibacteraeota bacterium]